MSLMNPALILAADTWNGGFWLPQQASTQAPSVDSLFNFILWISIFFSSLIFFLLILFVVKYRHRPGVTRDPAAGHNNALEITWTVIPTLITLVIYYYGFRGYLHASSDPPLAYDITAIGQMWKWSFTYPGGTINTPELHVPVHTPVRLVLQSQDVIHSLSIPAFRVKKDVVPGRYNRMWFEATQTGEFDIYCAAYCGTNHSSMLSKVIVHTPDDFARWLKENATWRGRLSPIAAGQKLYVDKGCAVCHSINGTPGTGPTWKDMFGNTIPLADGSSLVADEEYVHESILKPQAKLHRGFGPVMPTIPVTEDDIFALQSFMKSISVNFKGDLKPLQQITPAVPPTTSPVTLPPAVPQVPPNVGKRPPE